MLSSVALLPWTTQRDQILSEQVDKNNKAQQLIPSQATGNSKIRVCNNWKTDKTRPVQACLVSNIWEEKVCVCMCTNCHMVLNHSSRWSAELCFKSTWHQLFWETLIWRSFTTMKPTTKPILRRRWELLKTMQFCKQCQRNMYVHYTKMIFNQDFYVHSCLLFGLLLPEVPVIKNLSLLCQLPCYITKMV